MLHYEADWVWTAANAKQVKLSSARVCVHVCVLLGQPEMCHWCINDVKTFAYNEMFTQVFTGETVNWSNIGGHFQMQLDAI